MAVIKAVSVHGYLRIIDCRVMLVLDFAFEGSVRNRKIEHVLAVLRAPFNELKKAIHFAC